jgi:hypothetical protein
MRACLAALLAAAALITSIPAAEARDGCGRGWYFDGRACRPAGGGGYGGPVYRGPVYGGGGYNAPIPQQDNFGRPEVWFRPYRDPYGRLVCAQRDFTVQDGYCKPYRGY